MAFNVLYTPDLCLSPAVVELEGSQVCSFYSLVQEQPGVEWWGGSACIECVDGVSVLHFRGRLVHEDDVVEFE